MSGCSSLEEVLPFYMDADRAAEVDVFVAHKWAFEAQWLGEHLQGRPAICTYKAALRLWPDAPGYSNQVLRYWLRPKGLSPVIAGMPHRGGARRTSPVGGSKKFAKKVVTNTAIKRCAQHPFSAMVDNDT